jgi:hypothetical protein
MTGENWDQKRLKEQVVGHCNDKGGTCAHMFSREKILAHFITRNQNKSGVNFFWKEII